MSKRKDSKSVYFNLDNSLERELHAYVSPDKIRNFSAYVKELVYEDMKRNRGANVNPFAMLNSRNVMEDGYAPEPVPVQVPRERVQQEEEYVEVVRREPAPRRQEPVYEEPVQDIPEEDAPEDNEVNSMKKSAALNMVRRRG